MNSRRFDGVHYQFRPIKDLKDILVSSTRMFADQTAYLVKDKSVGRFVPITYRTVGKDYQALGTKFLEMGLSGEKIGVIGETRYEWLLTYFATVAGVGVIVPLDKNLPKGELLGLIKRSGMKALVFSDKCRKSVEPLIGKTEEADIQYFISMDQPDETEDGVLSFHRLLEDGRRLVAAGRRDYLEAVIDPDQMSTLLFTSGTTGLAKGVKISHANITSNVYAMSKFFKIPEPGIVFSVLPIHHVYEMTCDIWTTFYQGKTIAICEGIKYIQKNMEEIHPNVMLGVPLIFEKFYKGMFRQAKHRGEDEKLRRAIDLSKRLKLYRTPAVVRRMFKTIHDSFGGQIKDFVVGGAAADPFIMSEFEAMGFPMVQGYGMTECAPIIALNPDRYRKTDAVGEPLPGTTIKVIDQDEDGIGELIVKGPSVMLGYYENEEATQEALQNGWLHTGDLGYCDEDGFYHLTGRSKTVIVTKGGKNIFPEEVEDVILKNELVKEVLVHGVQDDRVGNVIITADIYPDYEKLKEEKGEMTRSEIYHFYSSLIDDINETMPPYKQVKRVNIRETEFVKTTTGKIKRFGNRLSGEEIAAVDEGTGDYYAVHQIEEKRAKELVEMIRASEDPHILHRDLEPVSDIKSLLDRSLTNYSDRIAFAQKLDESSGYLELTYQQAAADREGLGTALINRGLDGKRFALLGRTSYAWQTAFLTLATGVGVPVALDTQLDPEELARQIRKIGAEVLVYDEEKEDLAAQVLQAGASCVTTRIRYGAADEQMFAEDEASVVRGDGTLSFRALTEEGKKQIGQGDRQYLDAKVTGKDMAAIFFTSGRSGKAKAVGLTHMNITADLLSTASVLEMREEDVVFSVIPPNNMYQCGLGILMPLYKGACIANFESVASLEQDMDSVRPTILLAEPVILEDLYHQTADDIMEEEGPGAMDDGESAIARITKRTGLDPLKKYHRLVEQHLGGEVRMIVSGGSRLDPKISRFLNDAGITTIQGYGMTECGSVAAMNPDDRKLLKDDACGHLLPGIRIRVADKASDGVGEVFVKGRNVMNGYIDEEEETKKALQNDWFRTGDIGYIDDDGFLHLMGRVDEQEENY